MARFVSLSLAIIKKGMMRLHARGFVTRERVEAIRIGLTEEGQHFVEPDDAERPLTPSA